MYAAKTSVGGGMSPPVQELPSAYKWVRLYCLPLRGLSGHVPALQWRF